MTYALKCRSDCRDLHVMVLLGKISEQTFRSKRPVLQGKGSAREEQWFVAA